MKTIFQLKSYILFLWKSSNHHGVHSPFVFNLMTKCLYNKKKNEDYSVLKSKIRSIINSSTLKKPVANTFNNAKLLLSIIQYFKPSSALEIGESYEFISTIIQLGNPKTKIVVLNSYLKMQLPESFDLIYFNFSEKPLYDTFINLLTKTHNDSLFIFKGIHKTLLMEELWAIIKRHEKVTITIDTYNFGLIFFRKEQAKEHFMIRL